MLYLCCLLQVKAALSRVQDMGATIEAVPYLMIRFIHRVCTQHCTCAARCYFLQLPQVKAMLSRVQDVDAIIDAVPYLMSPKELQQSLANLSRWFPNQDPCECLAAASPHLLGIAL
jgi:hypothetical protein